MASSGAGVPVVSQSPDDTPSDGSHGTVGVGADTGGASAVAPAGVEPTVVEVRPSVVQRVGVLIAQAGPWARPCIVITGEHRVAAWRLCANAAAAGLFGDVARIVRANGLEQVRLCSGTVITHESSTALGELPKVEVPAGDVR